MLVLSTRCLPHCCSLGRLCDVNGVSEECLWQGDWRSLLEADTPARDGLPLSYVQRFLDVAHWIVCLTCFLFLSFLLCSIFCEEEETQCTKCLVYYSEIIFSLGEKMLNQVRLLNLQDFALCGDLMQMYCVRKCFFFLGGGCFPSHI